MTHSSRPLLALPLLFLLPVLAAQANLTVHPMRSAVVGQKGTQIRVYSQSPQVQFVQASLQRIVGPADVDEHELAVDPGEAAIAITPARFALAGGGNRLVRIIPLQAVTEEQAYRVYFEGVRGPDPQDVVVGTDGARASVGVSLVWGALINVVPDDGVVGMELVGDMLHNTGTLRLGVTTVADCSAGGVCTAHDISRSVYPGSSVRLPIQPEPGHTLQLRYQLTGDGYREHLQLLAATVDSFNED